MLDLCLVSLPNPALQHPTMYQSLGLLYLAAIAERYGYSTEVSDLRDGIRPLPEAKFYGFSCTTPEITYAKQIANQIKGKGKTIVGGAHPSLLPEDCSMFNYIVRGEGEEVLPQILAGQLKEGYISAPRIKNLDTIPFPHWTKGSAFSDTLFPGENYGNGEKAATLIGSRGCPYLCAFCLPKNTQVLMTDMRWLNIQDIKIGDMVVGVRKNARWKYTMAEVTNILKRKAMVYAIETEDGTVYSTKEHPWLMHNKFQSIQDIENNRKYNASFNSERAVLRKLATPIHAPKETRDYKKGYIAGVIVGDGCLRIKHHIRPYGKGVYDYLNLGIVGDYEMLDRVLKFAEDLNIHMHERKFNGGKVYPNCTRIIVCNRHHVCKTIEKLIYHAKETYEYKRGFLSGIYDAEGSFSQSALRISNNDEGIKQRIQEYLTQFGFQSIIEKRAIRITGGLAEHIKFLSIVLSAVAHKRSRLFGRAVYGSSRIKNVRQMGEMEVFNLSTSTENFIADGFVTHNCANLFTKPVVYRSVENICQELIKLKKLGVRHFRFEDDNFTLHPEFDKLCAEIKKLDIKYKCHTRANLITLDKARRMLDSGCEECGLGVESADDEVLKLNNKKTTYKTNARAVNIIKDAGLRAKTYWMAGLPGETDKTLFYNIQFMEETKPDKWTLSCFTPYPGCDVWRNPDKFGVEITNKHWETWWNFVIPEKHLPIMTGREGFNHVLKGQSHKEMEFRHNTFRDFLEGGQWQKE